jgi:RNA polymerase sigma factor (sigma-70 family)
MDDFEDHRDHLHAVAFRMLGSRAEADDALQEAWIRYDRADTSDVENIGGWLTTVVSRVCLTMLDSRKRRREDALDDGRLPDPIIAAPDAGPEDEALLADAVGAALLVVLETLQPAERLAFVLHDLFAVPFDDVARIVDRSPDAARQLASRARRRVRGANPDAPTADRAVVTAFAHAAREGDFAALLEVLDPDITLRADAGTGALRIVQGARDVANSALSFRDVKRKTVAALVDGRPGYVGFVNDRPIVVMTFTVRDSRVVGIDILADRARVAALDLDGLAPGPEPAA